MFFGVMIRMYYAPKEHDPPHVHALYQGVEAVFAIADGAATAGELPIRQTKLVQA